MASTAATILGTFASIGIFYMKRIPKNIIMNITYLPVLNADIITGISLLLLFNLISLPLGYISIIIAHICVNVPYVILSVMPKLKQMDNNLYEAALDLGSTPLTALRKVIFPEILPGVISGFLLSITMSVDDFVVSFFTSGPLIQTLSIEIYSMTKRGVSPKINALSTILFLVVLSILIFTNVKNIKQKNIKKEKERSFV
jgi:spermidine/putrescine transport system permease protein